MKFDLNYESFILNFFGEFNKFTNDKEKKIKFLGCYSSFSKFLPYKGKLKSRLSFLIKG